MKGEESVKGEYDGKSLTGEGHSFGGRRKHFEVRIYLCGRFSVEISGVRSLALGVFGESEAGGTGLLGVLGTGARIPFGFLELGSRTGCS
jgi:hypothetical protein